MEHNYWYVFECNYGERVKERKFLKDVLKTFDKDYATMVGVVVNNNPYCFSFDIAINLQDDPIKFEEWVKKNYPEKLKRHNVFLHDVFEYNVLTFVNENGVDDALTEEGGTHPFLFPEKEYFENTKPQFKCLKRNMPKVFISHSSKDKELIVNTLNAYLQANNIATWFDSYEIDYGDNIYMKVTEGIEKSAVGLFILTDNFFDSESGWPMTEFSAFFMELMKSNKKVLMLNAGVSPEKMHAMMKVYKYIMWDNGAGLPNIANTINRIINS